MNNSLLNFTEAQKQLGVSRSTLLRWLRDKRITGYKAGKKWKFYPDDLNKVLLKESPSVYVKSDIKELIKLLYPLLPETLRSGNVYSPDFWCEWQDIDQWIMITLFIKDNSARIELIKNRLEDVRHLKIPVSKAIKLNRIWEIWSKNHVNATPRPGKYTCLTGTNGYKISTLQLPAHIEHVINIPDIPEIIKKKISDKSFCDIYVYGPPNRITAFTAYLLLSYLMKKHQMAYTSVFTSENEPTYFFPGALQIYGDILQTHSGTKFSLTQIEVSDLMQSRGISSPPFRIAYAFGKRPDKLKESENIISLSH